jgi:putative peptidoglycan lipid II flippase
LAPLFPVISERTVRNDMEGLKKILRDGSQVLFFAVTPVVTAVLLLRVPIVQLLFQRGEFSPEDTAMTAGTLLFYSPFILAMTLNLLSSQVMINLKLAAAAAKLSGLGVLLNLVLCLLFMRFFDVGGIALATTLAFYLMTWISVVLIERKIGSLGLGRLLKPGLKVVLACCLAAIPAYFSMEYLETSWDVSRLSVRMLALLVEGGSFFGSFALLAGLFRMEEISMLLGLIKTKGQTKKLELSVPAIGGG